MARKGRKRKEGRRTRSGKLSEANSERAARGLRGVMDVVLSQPHRAWLGKGRRDDQLAENALGRLLLAGKITESEYWAGDRWRKLVGEFHQVLASPVMPGSAMGRLVADEVDEDSRNREERSGTTVGQETDEERRERVLVQHAAAMTAIRRLPDRRQVFVVMESVVLREGAVDEVGLKALRQGLGQLARLWRMEAPDDPLEERLGPKPKVRAARCEERPGWQHEERELDISYK
ncbi:hypothetical protein [Ancylobacter polymorphus]|uniref:DUF5681 domain-containing protein n=1 Tax=Ancylobacter polymorphus TaxID=223390 RepID=A0ABU0BHJ4_9HYPH|nr:hypothetical protein [Ancylobacter polymorphus]MDQ0305313.1 hypothetical protein [Ancylobacter polymorphus]